MAIAGVSARKIHVGCEVMVVSPRPPVPPFWFRALKMVVAYLLNFGAFCLDVRT